MQSVGSFFSSVSKFYNELNPATLSGAIDVVVVEQSNGDLACSPFHVRFGKLSILLPQEKVVEVEVNGHLVNFPMKVGDAGEAFFVFETEQDVPEEFATSPLAGPAQVKTEEEIDFLDLSQGGGTGHPEENNKPQAGSQDVIETGYVSAHSGHGSDFEEDENDCLSTPLPARKGKGGGSKTRFNEARIEIDDSGRPIHDQDSSHLSVGTRHAMSISLPASPVLKPYNEDNIMDIFKPVDTDGQGLPWRHFGSPTVQSPDAAPRSGFLTPYHNDVIMDMTGYKTDDSAETDLSSDAESESGSRKNKSLKARVKKARARPARKGRARQDPKQQTTAVPSKGADPANKQADPTLFTRGRQKDGSRPSSRSLSLPNLAELDDNLVEPSSWTGFSQTLLKEASSGHVKLDEEDEARLRGALEDLQRHENEQSKVNGPQQRRFGHKRTESQMQSKKQVPRPNSAFNALSDTELEYQTPRTAKETEWSWGWGSLPVKNEDVDEAIKDAQSHVSIDIQETPKPVPNEMTIEGEVYRVAISVCPGDDFGKDLEASETLFAINQISFEEFSKDPLKVLNNKNLVCLINDRYFTWAAAGPYLTSLMLFRKPLSDDVLHQLSSKDLRPLPETSEGKSQQETTTRFGALSRWLRGSQPASSIRSMEQGQAQRSPSMNDSPEPKRSSEGSTPVASYEPMTRSTSMPVDTSSIPALDERVALETPVPPEGPKPKPKPKRYAKTLRLTSEQLKSLNLKKGANSLTFSVTSSYQGKAICSARLFLWNHDYQVVISDIDGTITKSDALGHIFTMAGKDWTHAGVAKLYTDIVQNGYHILYLTSRAIGQADYTRKYLKGVEQDNYQLPDGPVIMSPDRLMTAFHREVIMRKPEEFKMACLRDIRRLFEDRSPFYAGFGNRITDALSYRSVNVPSSRIFTIDSGGEVKLELLSSYKSS
ncbi:hypothetical protein BGW38_003722 [Lunasporangiospora selenospora]|uniref:phosphatidate phosphatase n=1 Tax=Lunasporangiospora selenospora TaxID=979761 RepID=A0A9P6KCN0_9FUNG|nr:hypothetical protein BGW38_003722 [Lunasporangiospora selenospora]